MQAAKRLKVLATGFLLMFLLLEGLQIFALAFLDTAPAEAQEAFALPWEWVRACLYAGCVFVVPAVVLLLFAVWSIPTRTSAPTEQRVVRAWCTACWLPFCWQWIGPLLERSGIPVYAAATYAGSCATEIAMLYVAWRCMQQQLGVRPPCPVAFLDLIGLPATLVCVLLGGYGADTYLSVIVTPLPLLICALNLGCARSKLPKARLPR